MAKQRARYFNPLEAERLLTAIGECREVCCKTDLHFPINGDVHKASRRITEAIDDLAGVLTGDRTHFHLKTAPGGISYPNP